MPVDRTAAPRADGSRGAIQARSLTVLSTVALLIVGTAFVTLYRLAMARARVDLVQLVTAQATLIERIYAGEAARTGDSTAARAHALSDFAVASVAFRDFGRTGELVLGERRLDNNLYFLLPERSLGGVVPPPVPFGGRSGEALQRAVDGETGVRQSLDFRGNPVVAAYRHLPLLEVGLVAKLDVSEVRAPFLRAAGITLAVAFVVLLLGSQWHLAWVGPLLTRTFVRTRALESSLRVADASTERYATLFRSAHDPMLIESLDGRVLEANAAAGEIWGGSAEALIGRRATELFPETGDAALAAARQRAASGRPTPAETRVTVAADGSRRTLFVRLAPLRDERGEVTAVSSLAKDITELEAARQSLEARNVALEEAVRARTEELEQELKVCLIYTTPSPRDT